MQYKFKQAVKILEFGDIVAGKRVILNTYQFAVGTFEVPEAVEQLPQFIRYVQVGWIEEATVLVSEDSPIERQQKVVDKLINRKDAAAVEKEEKLLTPSEEDVAPPEEKKHEKKSGKKKG